MTRFRFVEKESAQFPVWLLRRTVGVTRQGFYAWKHRPPSKRDLADRELCERIRRVHAQTEGIYGSARVDAELRLTNGIRVGRKRVARLMRQLGLQGADGRRGGPRTTARNPQRPSAPDLVDRRFTRASPNRLWVCDLKYIQTGQGFLFLAAAQDVYSRRIIGRSMRDKPQGRARTGRARDGRQRARPPKRRRCRAPRITDPQYTSLLDGAYAKQSGIDLSTGSVGDPWDNALAETFPASLEKELLRRERFATREQARTRIFWHIECFYNTKRRHSSLHYPTPTEYEQRHDQEATAA